MMFKTHLAFAIFFSLFLIHYFNINSPILFSLTFIFASILPDIDTSRSKIGIRAWPFSNIISLIFGHRGFFHTIWLPALAFTILFATNYHIIGFAFFSGYLLHLLCDLFTLEGVRPFYPLWNKRFSGCLKTGSFLEHFLLFVLVLSISLFILDLL